MERATPRTRNASANPWVRQMQCVSPPLGKPANSRPPALGSPLLKGTSPVAAGAEIDTVPARPGAKDTPPPPHPCFVGPCFLCVDFASVQLLLQALMAFWIFPTTGRLGV